MAALDDAAASPCPSLSFSGMLVSLLERQSLGRLRPQTQNPSLAPGTRPWGLVCWVPRAASGLQPRPSRPQAGSALTLTSCWGKGPREFSGTLMGGMTQSRFCRLSPRASWCWGHGSSVSLGARAGSGSAAFLPFCSTTWRGERSHDSG